MCKICSAFCLVLMLDSVCSRFQKGTQGLGSKRIQREMFETRREELTEDCSKMSNQELHDLYYLTNIFSGESMNEN